MSSPAGPAAQEIVSTTPFGPAPTSCQLAGLVTSEGSESPVGSFIEVLKETVKSVIPTVAHSPSLSSPSPVSGQEATPVTRGGAQKKTDAEPESMP